MRGLYVFFVMIAVTVTLLLLDQIWFNLIAPATFSKLLISLVVISGLALAIYLLKKEFIEEKKLKKDKFTN